MRADSLEDAAEHDDATRLDTEVSPTSGASRSVISRASATPTTDPSALAPPSWPAPQSGVSLSARPPAEWLDSLLAAAASLEPDASVCAIVDAVLSVGARCLSGITLGARTTELDGTPLVIRLSPSSDGDPTSDPTRLFPEHAAEHILPVPRDTGSTLHVACRVESLLAADTAALAFAGRLARVLGTALRQARTGETARLATEALRNLDARVLQREKLASLGQMAASIVHELNNPLTSILAYASFLRNKAERSSTDPADVERLRRIGEAAERVQRLASELIAYSRPGGTVATPVDLRDVIEQALLFCEPLLDETGVRIERDFANAIPVRGVSDQLTQVFVNLFTNAAQAMSARNGVVHVTAATTSTAEISVTVVDNGRGIEPKHLPHIFEPFFTTKTDGSGTGLGLSIVRSIVVAHGGRIQASALEPHGMAFCLHLPAIMTDDEPR